MEITDSKRLDHHGIVSGTLADLKIIDRINSRLSENLTAKVSDGECIAAMIINGLGFTSRPLTLTPQFFESKALDLLFAKKITPSDLNRHRLGRCLDRLYSYGCDRLFTEISMEICADEGIETQFVSLDTTSFSVSGEYDSQSDEHSIHMTRGYSKDHRPDLKQVVLELLVSQDGGVPLACKSADGNASDSILFKERTHALMREFKASETPKYLVADSKLYSKDNTVNLKAIPFITRIPSTLSEERSAVNLALTQNQWSPLESSDENKYRVHHCTHYGMEQRWLVIYSIPAHRRATKTLERRTKKEVKNFPLQLKKLNQQAFNCEKDAEQAVERLKQSLRFHTLADIKITAQAHYEKKGRPKQGVKPHAYTYTIEATIQKDQKKSDDWLDKKSCYVIGTNTDEKTLPNEQVIAAYKGQNASVERGFRFLKDPYFFVASFFLKKTSRIMALLTIMTLALLIYSVAQRRLRQALKDNDDTLPNQINQDVPNPTLRWVFQMLDGINVVYFTANHSTHHTITGLDKIRTKIIHLFGKNVRRIYGFSENLKN